MGTNKYLNVRVLVPCFPGKQAGRFKNHSISMWFVPQENEIRGGGVRKIGSTKFFAVCEKFRIIFLFLGGGDDCF